MCCHGVHVVCLPLSSHQDYTAGWTTTSIIYTRASSYFSSKTIPGWRLLFMETCKRKKENVVYLSNHQCTDWIIADMLAIRQKALGHVRYVLKDGLKWLPLYGWYFSQHGGVYVKRSAKFDEKAMKKKLSSQTVLGTPMYLVIFPEGTRYNPELKKMISDSQAFATKEGEQNTRQILTRHPDLFPRCLFLLRMTEMRVCSGVWSKSLSSFSLEILRPVQGLAALDHVLTPRMKASHVAIETMRDHLDAVYDITVVYEATRGKSSDRQPAPTMPDEISRLVTAGRPTTCPLDPIPSSLLQTISGRPSPLPHLAHQLIPDRWLRPFRLQESESCTPSEKTYTRSLRCQQLQTSIPSFFSLQNS
ncbi:1-acyl-sn-glycerol-3-phosphate acyltransferase epsilon-like isoform X2 [Oncorhynchus nerka]|uniref:1-acyl-sn-glycerol-3-phosphate acyltransferase epsilon-like isoform X2 n=1 Tax=Oncorhynchus nerka TaxID=8023 RepID=UPI0031B88015